MMYDDDGRFVSEEEAAVRDEVTWRSGSIRLLDPETRHRMSVAARAEQRVMDALLTVADRCGDDEQASFFSGWRRGKETEADRIAREHGFGQDRIVAMKGLARWAGVPLETVLRAALRGELRSVVELGPAERRTNEDGFEIR